MSGVKNYNYLNLFKFCVVINAIFLVCSCRHESNELAHNHDHNEAVVDDDDHHHSPTHIIIAPQQAEKLGVKTTEINPSDFQETILVDGVIDYSPTGLRIASARSGGIVSIAHNIFVGKRVNPGTVIASISGSGVEGGDAIAAARVRLEGAKRELDRITPLHADGIVSTRDYNAVLREYEAAKASTMSNSTRESGSVVLAPSAGIITAISASDGQAVAPGEAIAEIASDGDVMLRANLPLRYVSSLPAIYDADFRQAGSTDFQSVAEAGGKRISSNSRMAQNGYVPVCFTLPAGEYIPGTVCEVFLHTGVQPSVISVPIEALSEQQGQMYVFVQLDADGYEKRNVKIGKRSASAVEIVDGVAAGEKVVTSGTTFVRMAESAGIRPEGHSHNH